MLLIVTNRNDHTADWLVIELRRRRASFVRFNTEDYPLRTRLVWAPTEEAALRVGDVTIRESDIHAVWYRRPVPPVLDRGLSSDQRIWAEAEAREALDGLWRTLPARWVNHPDRNRTAQSKPAQLRAASDLGFKVPASVITNDATTARDFVAAQPAGAVCKPLRSGRLRIDSEERLFFTSRVSADDDAAFARLTAEPYLFQQRIDKAADVRVTVIGDEAHAVRIASQDHPDSELDFRRRDPASLRHDHVQLPDKEANDCVRFVRDAGCLFGAIDLVEAHDGSFWFLENNPNGQWAWLEQLCDVPLRARLADLLLAS